MNKVSYVQYNTRKMNAGLLFWNQSVKAKSIGYANPIDQSDGFQSNVGT